jgi:F-type H+-transporting ATPase subunit c
MRFKTFVFMALFLLFVASPIFAQGTAGGAEKTSDIMYFGAAIGMAIASGLCGLGQGRAVASSAEAVARNPGARAGIQTLLVLGLAFIESLAIFTLLIIFVK